MLRAKFLLCLLAACTAHAFAQDDSGNTLQDELRAFTKEMAGQCKAVKDQLADFKVLTDPLTRFTLRDAVQSLCVCLPEKAQAFRSSVSSEDLARPTSADGFLSRLNPAVIDRCAAEQMRAMYGEDCPERFTKEGMDAASYCTCMREVVNAYSEATTAAIAAAASDYLPAAAVAEQTGSPVPPRPPVLEDYFQADQQCKAE
jgi:hypothetical protein